MIFQSLEDLESACAEAVSPGMAARENQQFEVGVFSGVYVTPVHAGYFDHLEKIRGETRKMKMVESAREAVANGSAGQAEFDLATKDAKVNGKGEVVLASTRDSRTSSPKTGNDAWRQVDGKRKREGEEDTPSPRERMDISLHNFGDYTG